MDDFCLPDIIYEDNHLIAVNKKPGDLVQGDRSGTRTLADSLKVYLKQKYHKKGNVFLGIPHRLDRPTSGIVVYTRTEKALGRTAALFREGKVKKTYWAVTDARPAGDSGELCHYLVKNGDKNISRAFSLPVSASKKGTLRYTWLGASDRYHLLEIEPDTGRHHQIRAQLAAAGIHIKGDVKYGARRSNPNGGIHLHARRLEFTHPVTMAHIVLTAEPPADPVWDYFRKITGGG